jgi:hypothetical protein
MKKIVFFLLVAGFLACDSDKSVGNGDNAQTETGDLNNLQGSAFAPVALGDNNETRILTKDFWVFEFYVSDSDFEGGKANRGRWYQFNMDGTFASGHWQQQTAYGSWKIDYSERYPMIIIDSYKDSEDCAWQLHSLTPDQTEMSWVGGKGYPNYADMAKLINLMTMPTKKQFGDE